MKDRPVPLSSGTDTQGASGPGRWHHGPGGGVLGSSVTSTAPTLPRSVRAPDGNAGVGSEKPPAPGSSRARGDQERNQVGLDTAQEQERTCGLEECAPIRTQGPASRPWGSRFRSSK